MPRVRLEAWHFSGSVTVDALVILGRLEVRRDDRRRAYLVADLALDLARDGVGVAQGLVDGHAQGADLDADLCVVGGRADVAVGDDRRALVTFASDVVEADFGVVEGDGAAEVAEGIRELVERGGEALDRVGGLWAIWT